MEKGAKQNMWSKLTINVYDMRKKSTQHEENAIEIADCSCFRDFYCRIFEVSIKTFENRLLSLLVKCTFYLMQPHSSDRVMYYYH